MALLVGDRLRAVLPFGVVVRVGLLALRAPLYHHPEGVLPVAALGYAVHGFVRSRPTWSRAMAAIEVRSIRHAIDEAGVVTVVS